MVNRISGLETSSLLALCRISRTPSGGLKSAKGAAPPSRESDFFDRVIGSRRISSQGDKNRGKTFIQQIQKLSKLVPVDNERDKILEYLKLENSEKTSRVH